MSDDRKPKQTTSKGRLQRLLGAGRAAVSPNGPADRDGSAQQAWRRVVRRRTLVVLAFLALWMTGLQARLGYLQVVRHDKYAAAAAGQQQATVEIEALRGDILDRNGQILAYSVKAREIFADPKFIEEPKATAAAICEALRDCSPAERAELGAKLQGPRRYHSIRRSRRVSPDQVDRVLALDLPGIGVKRDSGRYYPYGELAAHIIGFVGQDGTGQAGIEHAYNATIQGQDGLGHAQVDNQRRRVEMQVDLEPVPGATLELTIDAAMQVIAERALKEGVVSSRARGGTAIITNPRTGEVLALANYPTFNPNIANQSPPDARVNRATLYAFEPGSTFKIVTACAALQEGIISPYEMIDTNPGYIKFAGRKAITETSGHNYGVLTFEDALVKSSNVAAIKVGLRTGTDLMVRYVERFGFGARASRDFPGRSQSSGIWNPAALNESGLASVSMGYQIAVTPIQMIAAVGAVANGGLLIEPRVVRAVERNGVREVVTPNVVRRVMEERIARTMTAIMKNVVLRGTAKTAYIEGYPAAAKTGTSTRLAETGGYSRRDYNASMVGFVPADHPELAILVVIDSPRTSIYGGTIAGPVFRRISEDAMIHLGIAPSGETQTPMTVRAGGPDRSLLRRVSVIDQQPSLIRTGGPMVMPDLKGLSAREAHRVLNSAGLSARMSGSGFVEAQMPEAGSAIEPGGTGVLVLRRNPALREGNTP